MAPARPCGSVVIKSKSLLDLAPPCYDADDHNRRRRYVAVKVCCVRLSEDGRRDTRPRYEWDAYTHMSGMFSENPGFMYLRQIEDRFIINTPSGIEHPCFVFRPAGLTLEDFQRLAPNADIALLKDIVKAMLQALDFLHNEAHIVHTDIKVGCNSLACCRPLD